MFVTTCCLLLAAVLCQGMPYEGMVVIDLSHELGPDTVYWPGNPKFNFTILARGPSGGGYWYESNKFQTAEHGGTHVDSPSHFAKDKKKIDEIPMSKLVGPGVVINVTNQAAENLDYQVTKEDVQLWEAKHGQIPEGAIVIMNSGWHKKYPNKTLVFGTDQPDTPSTFHFPAWHEDTIDWLIKNRNINVIGVDTPSIDYGRSTTFPVHVLLGGENIVGAENVANLDAIPESGCMIYVSSLKLVEGSGSPARIFATCMQRSMINSAPIKYLNTMLYTMVIIFAMCF